jgi:hypothetical protein
MTRKTLLKILFLVAVLACFFLLNRESQRAHQANQENHENHGLDRTSKIIYTKHARCRMACRHIDETEVQEILIKGRINHEKSDPASRPDSKYALEGITDDGQEVRIVFAAAANGMVVITVIDLQKEWSCNCK